ncbi:hypothetical protein X798_00016 [Onchocerca flexuosa]|uniref:Transposase n=2 Tax=Onchocerca flexuosa TaxID=387005 RepID=A0A183I4A8_9BILA|nr:hypothetical protein X798_00016 [Onchocerca flexuosa]VDP17670.1 unnamed protein product [Onchocerca flexuosa]
MTVSSEMSPMTKPIQIQLTHYKKYLNGTSVTIRPQDLAASPSYLEILNPEANRTMKYRWPSYLPITKSSELERIGEKHYAYFRNKSFTLRICVVLCWIKKYNALGEVKGSKRGKGQRIRNNISED